MELNLNYSYSFNYFLKQNFWYSYFFFLALCSAVSTLYNMFWPSSNMASHFSITFYYKQLRWRPQAWNNDGLNSAFPRQPESGTGVREGGRQGKNERCGRCWLAFGAGRVGKHMRGEKRPGFLLDDCSSTVYCKMKTVVWEITPLAGKNVNILYAEKLRAERVFAPDLCWASVFQFARCGGGKKNVYGCHFLTLIRWQRTWLSWFKLQKLSILGKFSPKQTVGSTCRNRNIVNCPTGVKFRCHINKLKIYKIMRNCPVRTD